jgi:D-glycero-D-manno-heptose 1,7-bisphosphate phosphatase
MNKAVFIDRDGTLNREVDFLSNPEQLQLIEGTVEALQLLKKLEYKLIVITNQSGIARGYFSEEDLQKIHITLQQMLKKNGVELDAIYYCPHHPSEGQAPYVQTCNCRKPLPGMILAAAEQFQIDLSKSFMIGDKLSDIKTGINAGCRTILVQTGYGRKSLQQLNFANIEPDWICANLLAAAQCIANNSEY